MTNETKARILERLTGEDDRARRALTRAAVDHALGIRLETLIDVPALTRLMVAAVRAENVHWGAQGHVRPAIERQRARSAALQEKIGDLLPADADDHVSRILAGARLPESRWFERLVDRALLSKLLSPVVQEILLSFAKRLPLPGVGGADSKAGALFGGLAGSAGKLFDVGKSLVGGISAEVDRRMREIARDFAENVGENVRGALFARVTSDEGVRITRELVLTALARLRDVPVADVLVDVDALPAQEVDAFIAAIADHNAARAALAEAVAAEISAALEAEGQRTLGELLDRGGLRAEVEAVIEARADAVLREFFTSEPFAGMLEIVLAE